VWHSSSNAIHVAQKCQYILNYLPRVGGCDLNFLKPGDRPDKNIREVMLPTISSLSSKSHPFLHRTFLDTYLGFTQRGIKPPHSGSDKVIQEMFTGDLRYLKETLLSHPLAYHCDGPDGKPWPAIVWWGVGTVIRDPEPLLEIAFRERVLVFADVFGVGGHTHHLAPSLRRYGHWATGFTLAIPGMLGEVEYGEAVEDVLAECQWWDQNNGGRMSPGTSIEFSNKTHREAMLKAQEAGLLKPLDSVPNLVHIKADPDPVVAREQATSHLQKIRTVAAGRPVSVMYDNLPEDSQWHPTDEEGRWKAEVMREVFCSAFLGPFAPRLVRKTRPNGKVVVVGWGCDIMGKTKYRQRGTNVTARTQDVARLGVGGSLRWEVGDDVALTVYNLDGTEVVDKPFPIVG
jgi:hypothetical protein